MIKQAELFPEEAARGWWCATCARFIGHRVTAPDGTVRHVVCGERVRLEVKDQERTR